MPRHRLARVQPGVVLDRLRDRAERDHHLTFGPDPSTHSRCTLGGMIGNNSCGTHSLLAGKTVDNVEELRILLYDGTQLTVGATSEEELSCHHRSRRAQRRDLRQAPNDSRSIRASDSRALSENSAARLRLQPRSTAAGKWISRGARAGGHRRHLRHRARSQAAADPQPAAQNADRAGLSRMSSSPPNRCPKSWSSARSGSKDLRAASLTACERRARANLELLPEGRGILLVEFGCDDPREAHCARAQT